MAESISYIKLGNQEHPIDAITVNGLSFTSEEKTRWDNKQDAITFDSIPTENSENMVKSGGVYDMIVENEYVISAALNDLNDRMLGVEDSISSFLVSESDPVFSSSVAASITASDISSWNAKQDALTFDSIPTENSENLVKSGDLYDVIVSNERVVATVLNNVNDRLLAVENRQTVPPISTNIQSDKNSLTKIASPFAVYNEVHPTVATTQPAGGMLPNVMYNFGTLNANTTFALATPTDANIVNHYFWTFDIGNTNRTIIWPNGISWFGGAVPEITTNKHYEVSVLNGIAILMEI